MERAEFKEESPNCISIVLGELVSYIEQVCTDSERIPVFNYQISGNYMKPAQLAVIQIVLFIPPDLRNGC